MAERLRAGKVRVPRVSAETGACSELGKGTDLGI